jgi:hypothetical protein
MVNSATSSNLTHVPPFQRPVQGSRLEGIRYPFAPSSRKVASGQFSHQYLRIHIARPHPIHTPLPSHSYSDFPPLSYSTARDQSPHIILIIRSTATRITDPFQEPTPRDFPSSSTFTAARLRVRAMAPSVNVLKMWPNLPPSNNNLIYFDGRLAVCGLSCSTMSRGALEGIRVHVGAGRQNQMRPEGSAYQKAAAR